MRVKLDEGAFVPSKAHTEDAGYDIRSREDKVVFGFSSEVFHTGVHVEIPNGWCGQVWSRSGLHVRNDITTTGMIDSGYSGEIIVKLTNHRESKYHVKKGDKIAQLVITPCLMELIEVVEDINGGERGDNGFGSSGR